MLNVSLVKEQGRNNPPLSLLTLLCPTGAFHWMNPNKHQAERLSGGCNC